MDASILTEANLDWLQRSRYDWTTVQRGRKERPPATGELLKLRTRCGLLAKA